MDQVPALADKVYQRWASLIESRTGVCVTPAWEGHARRVLGKQLSQLRRQNLKAVPGDLSAWWQKILDQLLIRETSFFRHRPSFDYLRDYLQPCADGQHLRLWSAGCATGEEAYSLAIAVSLAKPECSFEVVGSDISPAAIHGARKGTFSKARLRELNEDERRFFNLFGNRVDVCDSLAARVSFVQHNLIAKAWPAQWQNLDIIFCQNLLVYFSARRRDELVARLARCLKPGGRLLLGPGEYLSKPLPGLQRDRRSDVLAFVRVAGPELEY